MRLLNAEFILYKIITMKNALTVFVLVYYLTALDLVALSNLVIASYTEDTYGVVQKSLGDVITSIVKLRDVSTVENQRLHNRILE